MIDSYSHFEKVCVWGWICLSANARGLSVLHLELCIKSRDLVQYLQLQWWKLINVIWGYIQPVEELPGPLTLFPSERANMKISVTCRRVIGGEILVVKGLWLKRKPSVSTAISLVCKEQEYVRSPLVFSK